MTRETAMHGERKPFHLSLRVKQGIAVMAGAVTLFAAGCAIQAARSQRTNPERSISGMASDWSPGVFGSPTARLVFVSNRTGNYHIYDKSLTSNHMAALTSGGYDDMNPQASPDQRDLVFYSDRSGSNQIYTLSLRSPSSITQLTHETGGVNDYDPVFMPDGRRVVYKKTDANGNYGDIWEMNADGSNQHDLTPGLIVRGVEGWKPTPVSDSEVVVTERLYPKDPYSDNLYALNVQSSISTSLTNNNLTNWFPDYSPQARKLIFVTKEVQDGNDVIATRELGSNALSVVVRMPGDNDDPSWALNGKYAVFLNNNDGPYDIYAVNVSNGAVHLLDKSPAGSDDLSPIIISG